MAMLEMRPSESLENPKTALPLPLSAEGEEWRRVTMEGYEAFYLVSSLGRVFSVRAGRTLRPQRSNQSGHLAVTLSVDGRKRMAGIHRLLALAFLGEPPGDGIHAAHKNGHAADNRLENLYWATPVQNAADRHSHGRQVEGSLVKSAKLTECIVSEIRGLLARGRSQRAVARDFGVTQACISAIVTGKSWKHVA